MSPSFQDSLAVLGRLSASRLDKTSRRIRKSLADAEWKMSVCLLAMVRTGGFRELGYSTISDYGEKVLNLSGKKLDWLLGTARALEHLPLLSRAFQDGKIGWGKVRALQTLATPETEQEWLDYALTHSTSEVAGKVSLSPAQWKRQRALEASLRKAPLATVAEVKEVLRATEPVKDKQRGESLKAGAGESRESKLQSETTKAPVTPGSGHADATGPGLESASATSLGAAQADQSCPQSEDHSQTLDPESPIATVEAPPSRPNLPPGAPRTIRLVVELTPDQYALYEAAETRLRARAGKRVAKGAVIAQMAETVLDQGSARARARHQVLIHTCESCRHAWYDNDRGVTPVGSEVLEEALRTVTPLKVEPPPAGQDSCCVSVPPGRSNKPDGLRPSDNSEEPGNEPNPPGDFQDSDFSTRREYIPNATLRALFARAGNCCERCGARGRRLDIHHTDPVCEGGGSSLEQLRLYCRACHTLHHRTDLEEKPRWRNARREAMEKAARRGGL